MFLKRYYAIFTTAVTIGLCLVLNVLTLFAQQTTLAEDSQPVIILGSSFILFNNVPINNLFLFAYHADTQQWEAIPFQIDEKDAAGDFFNPDETPGLDANDELVFIAQDVGDMAPNVAVWIDNPEAQTYPRYEIKITNPVDQSIIGWVYLYRSNTLISVQTNTDYIQYIEGPIANPAADTIKGLSYKLGNANNGFPNFLELAANGIDLLDRQKVRVVVRVIFSDVTLTEENFQNPSVTPPIDGDVRVIRELTFDITVSPFGSVGSATLPVQYFPYSLSISGELDTDPIPFAIKKLRQTFDLNTNALGMSLFSQNNLTGIDIDGNPDPSIDTGVVFDPEINWVQITGTQGTFVNMFKMAQIGDQQSLFYRDDTTMTETNDTGDLISIGDTGILVEGSSISGKFPLGLTSFYLKEQNQPNSLGSQLADLVKSPLSKEAIDQLFDPTVPVELASFTATVEKNNVHLIWLTATETNNYGFEIERRFQDSNEWTKIAFVPGNGTTTNPVHYDYFDRNLQPGTYEYRLKQIDSDGSFEYHGAVTAVVGIPQTFVLHQNFPNPFNPSTEIQYQLPSRAGEFVGKVRTFLKIYNLLGQEVRTLVDEEKAPGYYKVIWDGKDNIGRGVTSGVYIYRLQSGDLVDIKKMVFVQ